MELIRSTHSVISPKRSFLPYLQPVPAHLLRYQSCHHSPVHICSFILLFPPWPHNSGGCRSTEHRRRYSMASFTDAALALAAPHHSLPLKPAPPGLIRRRLDQQTLEANSSWATVPYGGTDDAILCHPSRHGFQPYWHRPDGLRPFDHTHLPLLALQ